MNGLEQGGIILFVVTVVVCSTAFYATMLQDVYRKAEKRGYLADIPRWRRMIETGFVLFVLAVIAIAARATARRPIGNAIVTGVSLVLIILTTWYSHRQHSTSRHVALHGPIFGLSAALAAGMLQLTDRLLTEPWHAPCVFIGVIALSLSLFAWLGTPKVPWKPVNRRSRPSIIRRARNLVKKKLEEDAYVTDDAVAAPAANTDPAPAPQTATRQAAPAVDPASRNTVTGLNEFGMELMGTPLEPIVTAATYELAKARYLGMLDLAKHSKEGQRQWLELKRAYIAFYLNHAPLADFVDAIPDKEFATKLPSLEELYRLCRE